MGTQPTHEHQFLKRRLLHVLLIVFASTAIYAQEIEVSGTVYDDTYGPLPGVTVIVDGTSKGTATDFDGNYSISVSPDAVLSVSYLGFITQKVNVANKTKLDITLLPDVAALDEVVVVGYGTQKKESVVGAISQLDGKELNQRGTVTNLTDAMSGSMPGITVLSSTGIPGGDAGDGYKASKILIRGQSTWNDASPLIMVDGVERDMNDIDPDDVKSISVLKDAAATSIFGVKGGNGVILITTKKGKKGPAVFKVSANMAFKNVSRTPRALDGYKSTQAKNYAIINELATNPTSWVDYTPQEQLEYYRNGELPDAFPNRDWADEMLAKYAKSYKVNMSVAGGTDFVKYFGSLGYTNDGDIVNAQDLGQGYVPNFKYERFNFRTNLDFQLTKTTKFSVALSGYYGKQQRPGWKGLQGWHGIYGQPWTVPVLQYEDGTYGEGILYERFSDNNYALLNFSGTVGDNRLQIDTNYELEQQLDFITKGLSFTGMLAYDNFYKTNGASIYDDGILTKYVNPDYYTSNNPDANIDDYTNYFYPEGYAGSTHGFEFFKKPLNYRPETTTKATSVRLLYRFNLNYNRIFSEVHHVTALALFSRELVTAGGWPRKSEDWAGRVTYTYDRRYNIELNGAYNGSEKFGPGYKFDFFPAVGFGWTASNENFFEKVKTFMSLLRFRYSDGIVGNDNASNIGQWPFFTSYQSGVDAYGTTQNNSVFGYPYPISGPRYYSEGIIGNPRVRWETAHKQNYGVDIAFFNNKLSFTSDLFRERRKDILITSNGRNVPDFYGASAPAANLGETKTHGYELTANYRDSFGRFNYFVSANATFVKDQILYKEDPELLPAYQKQAGFQIGQTRSFLPSGIVNSWDEAYTGVINLSNNATFLPGDYRLLDYNADGYIDGEDKALYGYPTRPQRTYGFALGGDYKGFSLTFNFYGQYNATQLVNLSEFPSNAPMIYQDQLDDTWLPEYGNRTPTLRALTYNRSGVSDANYGQKDGAMFRLKTAELAYNLPKSLISSIGINGLRVFANGNNLWLWSNMAMDIEGQDFEFRNYPVTKQVNFGVTATF